MSRHVFKVQTSVFHARTGHRLYFYFECDYPTIEELTGALNEGLLVLGNRLWTRHHEDEEGFCYLVTKRATMALGRPGVSEINLDVPRLVEEPEQVAA